MQSLLNIAEIRTNLRFYGCPYYLQEWRRSNSNEGDRVLKTVYIDFSDAQYVAANSVVGDGIWQKCKLMQACVDVLVTCKNKEAGI